MVCAFGHLLAKGDSRLQNELVFADHTVYGAALISAWKGCATMPQLAAIILAAGQGTRMKSSLAKVLHPLAGKSLVDYPLELAKTLQAKPISVIVGAGQAQVRHHLKEFHCITQTKPLGTAHAVLAAKNSLKDFSGYVLILSGDVPLIKPSTLKSFISEVFNAQAKLGFISMELDDPGQYGRVIRDLDGQVNKVAEMKNSSADTLKIREVNAGVYCVEKNWLFQALKRVSADQLTGEYYLPEIIAQAMSQQHKVVAHLASDANEFLGVNTQADLALLAKLMRQRINERHMLAGVSFVHPENTYVDYAVKIGKDTTIYPGSFLQGNTKVGKACIIENGVVLKDAKLGDGVHVKAMSVVESSRVAQEAVLGPFARIRPDSKIGPQVKVGNFVEVKKTEMKAGSKASHLSYLGDAVIGAGANIGCGTITCNYDGQQKHRTIIGEGAFIGSDTQFVAPVRVGSGSTIGAGSTITKNVPAKSLAIARAQQVIVKNWQSKKKHKQ